MKRKTQCGECEKAGRELTAQGGVLNESGFIAEVRELLRRARSQAVASVNFIMVTTYWRIGKRIVEQEQQGKARAGYGEYLIKRLSQALSADFGKGLSVANLWNFRQLYQVFPTEEKLYTVCRELSWSHIRLIMRQDTDARRLWYAREAAEGNWSVRTLERKIQTDDYARTMAHQLPGVEVVDVEKAIDPVVALKDPYCFEFLGLPEDVLKKESKLESALIANLQKVLLEMGRGFAFIARQQRISTETNHFYIDLVFYNYLLKCFVLVDLKMRRLKHEDIGQMDMYVRMFDDLKRNKGDNPTIGLILCTDKDETIVRYSVLSEAKRIYAAKYRTILPDEEVLRAEIEQNRRAWESAHQKKTGRSKP